VAVERIDYQAGSVKAKGALVWNDKVSGKRPLLLIMPNWLGVTDIAIKRAEKMAGDKYIAFVADMYGEGKTCEGPPTSQEWMMVEHAFRSVQRVIFMIGPDNLRSQRAVEKIGGMRAGTTIDEHGRKRVVYQLTPELFARRSISL